MSTMVILFLMDNLFYPFFHENFNPNYLGTWRLSTCTENPRDHKGSGWPKNANSEEGVVSKIFEQKNPKNG